MNCQETRNKLPDYIDQQLAVQEVADIKAHLKGCRDCQKEYRLYKLACQSVTSLPLYSPSAKFNGNVLAALGLEYKPSLFPAWSKWAAGLASLALMWAGGAILAVIYGISRVGLAQTYLYFKNPQKLVTAAQFAMVKAWFVLSDAVTNVQSLLGWLLKGSNLPLQAGLSFLVAITVVLVAMRRMRYQVQH
jgi:anti-sigma factor RsiW